MTVNIWGRSATIQAVLAAAGGILAIVGVPLSWLDVPGDQFNGLDSGLLGGKIALLLGIAVCLLVLAWSLNVKVSPIAGLSVMALLTAITGALIVLVVVLVYFTRILSDESFSYTLDVLETAGVDASLGIGFLLEALGGTLALVGGVWALAKKS
jgi:hypothetical protein